MHEVNLRQWYSDLVNWKTELRHEARWSTKDKVKYSCKN